MPKDICEICFNKDLVVDVHHIHSRSKGGKDLEWNTCKLCPNCHRLVHMGDIILEGKFSSTNGMLLVWRYCGEPSVTGVDDPLCWHYGEERVIFDNDKNIIENYFNDLTCFCLVSNIIENSKIIDFIL